MARVTPVTQITHGATAGDLLAVIGSGDWLIHAEGILFLGMVGVCVALCVAEARVARRQRREREMEDFRRIVAREARREAQGAEGTGLSVPTYAPHVSPSEVALLATLRDTTETRSFQPVLPARTMPFDLVREAEIIAARYLWLLGD